MVNPTAGKQEAILVLGSSIVAGFDANLYDVPLADWVRWTSQFLPTPPSAPRVVTFDGANGRVNLTAHGMPPGTPIVFAGGTPPPEIPLGVPLYVANPGLNDFQVYTQYLPSLSGAHIPTFTGNGSGTTTVATTSTAGRPYEFKMPGVRMVTPRRPWANNTTRLVNTVTLANAITHQGAPISPTPTDQWLFINRGISRGNLRRIINYTGSQLLVGSNFGPLPVNSDEIVILQDAHTLVSVSADGLTVTQTDDGPAFGEADAGRFCSFFDSFPGGEVSRKIADRTDRTLTFDRPLTSFPCASPSLGAAPAAITFTDLTDRVNLTAHGFANGQAIMLFGGITPTGITQNVAVYVCNATANDFQLALTRGLALAGTNFTFSFSGSESGTTFVRPLPTFDNATHRVVLPGHGIPIGAGGICTALVFEGGTTPASVPQRVVMYANDVTADSFKLSDTWGNALTNVTVTFATSGTGVTTCKQTVNGFAVLRGANACHDLSTMEPPNAVLQDLTFTLNEVAPVFLTGTDYTNWDIGTPFASPRALSSDPTINAVPELAFHVKSRIDQPLVVLELGVSASMLSTFALPPEATTTLVGPMHDITSLDFSPTSPLGLYGILTKMAASMKLLVEAETGEGSLDTLVCFINLTDNDFDAQRRKRVGANMTLLRDELRQLLGAQLKWVMSGPARYMGGPTNNGDVYLQLQAMVAADPTGTALVDTRSWATDNSLFSPDALHLSALGEIRLAREWFEAWLTLDPATQTDDAGDDAGNDAVDPLAGDAGVGTDAEEPVPIALVVEDGTGKADADSYLSVEEFEALAQRYGNPTEISGATTAQKQFWLRTAARDGVDVLFNRALYGLRVTETQALEFPRDGCFDNRTQRAIATNVVPEDWKRAQFWYAWGLAFGIDMLEPFNAKDSEQRERWATATSDELPGGLKESRQYANGVPRTSVLPRMVAAAQPFLMAGDDSAGVA